MLLKIKNISLVKNAEIKLNGLTLIAGKNDSGKSTILKTIFAIIKSDNIAYAINASEKRAKEILAIRLNLVFDANVSPKGTISLFSSDNKTILDILVKDDNFVEKFIRNNHKERFFDSTFIPSPLIFDLIDFFNSIAKIKERANLDYGTEFNIKYPYIMWDLYDKLTKDNPYPKIKKQKEIDKIITNIINGNFVVEKNGKVSFLKNIDGKVKKIEMFNTAMGIKSFGILQLLNQNRFLDKKYILLIDEPEVHLHPEWELKMAHLIVKLVKKGIKVVLTSHSPYMIEGINLFAKMENLKEINFYLADNGKIEEQKGLLKIFHTLSIPMRKLRDMKIRGLCENNN
jgi:predicted ATP-dependent endonuclease of OLD family